ncbi:surfeit locus protein 6 homolog isoform X4 [Diaphorina citri]|uniref:Surfeit locus protein 6 homolog isoform X3 n=1 Tax=Diaphorina citri TaxID=121845 RepID=A0A3Q0JHQ0_DIACI|nr:surfeit locus protein 6 homolog isoform X3 [Diaphorina citri]XP_026686251.1 surfeit locus protein 6 homolog isoform X4 [Diaphorina citri]
MIDQLKTSSNMNDTELRKTIDTEYKFLSNVFEQIKQFRQSETVQEKGTERHVQVTNRTGKIKTAKELKEVQRAKTLEELHQRLDSYKASKAVKKGPNYERNLKRKIKKKSKVLKAKEERKKLARRVAKEKKAEQKREEEETKRLLEKANLEKKPNVAEIDCKATIKPVTEVPVAKGSIVFNKLDVVDESVKAKPAKDRPQVALQKLEKTQRLISKLKEKGNIDKAAKIQDKVLWNNVLNKAEGVRVKDDKEKIKKSIKRVEDRKKKSEKKWKERIEHTQKQMESRQKKRKENLKSRKDQKIKKKIKKSIKKGRTLPGVNDK